MSVDRLKLTEALVRLRKGPAMRHPDVAERIDPALREAVGIGHADPAPLIRQKTIAWIKRLLHDQSELQTAALVALALHPEADQKLLTDREAYLSRRLVFVPRTARRRVDEAIKQLVDAAVEEDHAGAAPEPARDDGFVVRQFWATMRLDTEQPELTERRELRVTAARLDNIIVRLSVPRPTPDDGDSEIDSEIDIRETTGCIVTDVTRCSPEDFSFTLRLPRTFTFGESLQYGIVFAIPAGRQMRHHYVFQPLVPCERFELTVLFGQRLPEEVCLIDGVTPRALDHCGSGSSRLTPNAAGTVKYIFTDVRQGLAYGVRWRPAPGG